MAKIALKEAVERELKRGACSMTDAWFLGMLKDGYEGGDWDTNRMGLVKKKYGLK